MRKIIENLGSMKGDKNDDSSTKLTCLQNSLLISIVGNPEKYLSYSEGKVVISKFCTYLVNSSSTLFHVQYMLFILDLVLIKSKISC